MAPRARGRAQLARASESEGCTTQVDCRPSVSGQTDARTHIGMASTRPTFVHSKTVRGLHARGRAHSAKASESNGVVCKAGCYRTTARYWMAGQAVVPWDLECEILEPVTVSARRLNPMRRMTQITLKMLIYSVLI